MSPYDQLLEETRRLRQERDAAFRELRELRDSMDRLTDMVGRQNEQLAQVVAMLRRREAQLRRAEGENRKLRRKLGVDDPEPEPEPDPEPGREPVPEPDAESPDDGPTASAEERGPTTKPESPKRKRSRAGGGRRPPPEHLPADIESYKVCACGHCGGPVFKRDVREVVLYSVVLTHLRRRVIRRERVVCADPDCHRTTTAPMPPMPAERTLYDASFLAWLVMMKFVLLVPLDRVRLLLASQGVDLAMGTLVHLISRAASLVEAVDGEHWRQLKAGPHICFDGTGLKTLVPGQDKAWDGYLEVFTRGVLTVCQFGLTKHADRLAHMLDGYAGLVVCDAESRNAAGSPGNLAAYCNAHPLRKLDDARRVQPRLAAQGMRFIQALYELEDEARERGLKGQALRSFRQRRSRRVVDRFRQWIRGVLARGLPPSDPVRKVCAYYDRHFEALTRFIDHPHIPLDNNESEREFQRHAKLRQASLFAGSPEGGERWATLYGVVRTAQKCDVDVQAYLTWLFERRGTHRKSFGLPVAELTPMAYKVTRDAERASA